MRYDTRINPEDHEPYAIKINGKKHPKRRIAIIIVLSLLCVACGALAFWKFSPYLYRLFPKKTETNVVTETNTTDTDVKTESDSKKPLKPKKPSKKTETNTKTPTNVITETNVTETDIKTKTNIPVEPEPQKEPEHVIPKDEWFMVLANSKHPLSKDYKVETAAADSFGHMVDKRIIQDLKNLLKAANKNGFNLSIATGYRSYDKQESIYNKKVEELIASGKTEAVAKFEASKLACKPGASDHNTGLGVDIVNGSGEMAENSNSYKWLCEHSWEYGFILRYPKGKESITGQNFETWHYRYVGLDEAKRIHESGLCLEEYLNQK